MVGLTETLVFLRPTAKPHFDFAVVDNGNGPFIERWNAQKLGTQPTPAEIAAAELPAAKALRIEADRQECRRRLTEQYGDALEQVSRASGLYGSTAQANHADGVTACVAASNTARDQINAAQSVAAVEAVSVAWPVLT